MKSEKRCMFLATTRQKNAENSMKMDFVHMGHVANSCICPTSTLFNCFFFYSFLSRKIQIKSQRISLTKVNSYADFINNVQDFWNKDEKIFFWLYQCRTRLEIFEKISSPKVEKKEKKVMEISDIIFQKND